MPESWGWSEQAALVSGFTPARNSIPSMISGSRFWPSGLRHFCLADCIGWWGIASAVWRLRQPLVLVVRCRTVANLLAIGFVVRMGFQCSAGEVAEGEQIGAVLGPAWHRPVVFHAAGFGAAIKGGIGIGFRQPDVFQIRLGFRLDRSGHRIQDVGGFMHPAARHPGLAVNRVQRGPKPDGPGTRWHRQPRPAWARPPGPRRFASRTFGSGPAASRASSGCFGESHRSCPAHPCCPMRPRR